jgi:uncharacterized protein YukE
MAVRKYIVGMLVSISCICVADVSQEQIQQHELLQQRQEELASQIVTEAPQVEDSEEDELVFLQNSLIGIEQEINNHKYFIENFRQEINKLQLLHFGPLSDKDEIFATIDQKIADQLLKIEEKNNLVKRLLVQLSQVETDKKLADQKLVDLITTNKQIKSDITEIKKSIDEIDEAIANLSKVKTYKLLKEYQKVADLLAQEKSAFEEVKSWDENRKIEYAQHTIQQRIAELENILIDLNSEIDSLSELCERKRRDVEFLHNTASDLAKERMSLEQELKEKGLPIIAYGIPSKRIVRLYDELKRTGDDAANSEQLQYAKASNDYITTLKQVADYSFAQEDKQTLDNVREEQKNVQKTFLERNYVLKVAGSAVLSAAGIFASCWGYKKFSE